MSSYNGPSLADLLVMVPDLLPRYILPQSLNQYAEIKDLRLVSKEVGAIVLRTVTSCSIKLGKSPCLPSEQVAALLKDTHLQSMEVTVDLSKGMMVCPLESLAQSENLAFCA